MISLVLHGAMLNACLGELALHCGCCCFLLTLVFILIVNQERPSVRCNTDLAFFCCLNHVVVTRHLLIWCLLPLRLLEVKHLHKCVCDEDFDCLAILCHLKGPLRIWLFGSFVFADLVTPLYGPDSSFLRW